MEGCSGQPAISTALQHPGDGRRGLLEDRLLSPCSVPCHIFAGYFFAGSRPPCHHPSGAGGPGLPCRPPCHPGPALRPRPARRGPQATELLGALYAQGEDVFSRASRKTLADMAATKADLELLKHELTIRIGAMVIAHGGFLAAIKFVGH